MKKSILLFLCLAVFSTLLLAQSKEQQRMPNEGINCIDSLGKDNLSFLNNCEAGYLNYFFRMHKPAFDFTDKCVLFMIGNVGSIKSDKMSYFNNIKTFLTNQEEPSHNLQQLITYTKEEIKELGYDAVIVLGSKKLITKDDVKKHLKQ